MEKVRHCLESIYDLPTATQTLDKIQQLIESYRAKIDPVEQAPPFTERDAVLITYGDTLYAEDEPPLRTLRRFAENCLQGMLSTIHILPFYPYSSDDGFAVKDFYAVNPQLGDWPDVRSLGSHFRLMFDAVFNHMSAQSQWFEQFLADEPGFEGLFYVESPDTDLRSVTRPRALPLLTPFQRKEGGTVHIWTTFSADQVDFDPRYPQTLIRLLDILLFYVAQGATFIRLDAICFLWKEPGTTSIHLPQTHATVQLMRAVLDVIAPHVILITETNVPHHENISYFGDGTNEAQLVYNFTLPPLLFHTMLTGNVVKLRDWINTLQAPSPRTTFFNFTASHDGIGVRPVEGILSEDELNAMIEHVNKRGGRVSYRGNNDGNQSPYELNITYIDAVIDPQEPIALQVKCFLVSQAVALSLAGVPAVYIHSLIGTRNDTDGVLRLGHNRAINRAKLPLDDVEASLADKTSFRARMFDAYSKLLHHRIEQAAFHPNAAQKAVSVGNDAVLAILRTPEHGNAVLGLFNVTGQAQSVDLSAFTTITGKRDVLTGVMAQPGHNELEPYGVYWFVMD